jgi:hypothetical protein
MCMAGTAFARVPFTKFKMQFISTESYYVLCADTTSKDRRVANNDYARLYVYENSSPKNNVYRISTTIGNYVSSRYYKDITDGTWMYYTEDVNKGKRVSLRGRPDSGVPECTVTGEFGAG